MRPNGAAVASTGGIASGPVSFMRVFNAAEAVKQGDTQGSQYGHLRVDHPDILEFINANTEINNFNISVGITEKFMHAVEMNQGSMVIDPHSGRSRKIGCQKRFSAHCGYGLEEWRARDRFSGSLKQRQSDSFAGRD